MTVHPSDAAVVVLAGPAPARSGCRARCRDTVRRAHHDRLLRVEADADELVELLELAVTWSELDYSGAALVPPEEWADFAADHDWCNPERVERLFGLAVDIALRPAGPAATARPVLHSVR